MNGAVMRAPLEVRSGPNTVSLCNLIPGYSYQLLAVPAKPDQHTTFELQPATPALQFDQRPTQTGSGHFTATGTCADFQITATDAAAQNSLPMYLSVKCESCPEAGQWKQNLFSATNAAVLQVQGGKTAQELITKTLIDGDCFDVENVSSFGNNIQIGTFTNGLNSIGFQNGVIIATGNIDVAPGPNDDDNAYTGLGNNQTPDSDLDNLTTGNLYNKAVIEFDFTPTETPVSFQFVFASEEYCEFVGSAYNDVFGFFISGPGITGTKNIALVPNTNTPITINNLNHNLNDAYYINNQSWLSGDLCGQFPSFDDAVNEIQYDGFTQPLLAVANVIPCQKYHIKLKIADVGDGYWDSAVFLKAGSFNGGGDATVDFVVNNTPGAQEASEGCGVANLVIDRIGSDNSQPVTVSFTTGGTALPGVDYLPLNPSYVIPAGQDKLTVPVTILGDLLTEGVETIVLTLDKSCSCDVSQKTLSILDHFPMGDTTIDVSICNSGNGVTLTANLLGGTAPFTYKWSTNQTTQSIFVNPTVSTTYTVTIVDACSDTSLNTFNVQVAPLVEITQNIAFCPGGSVTIGDSTYTQPAVVTENIPGQNGSCDTVLTYQLNLLPFNAFTDTIAFCSGDAVVIGGTTYTQPGTVTDTLPGTGGACDTIATYVLELLPLNTFTDTIAFCSGKSVVIGGVAYNQAGIVTDTLSGTGGACDTIATYVLEVLPLNTFTDTLAFCPGGSVTVGDSVYTQAGTAVLTLPGSNGSCDTIATYILAVLPQVSFTDTIRFCPGTSVTVAGATYSQPGVVPDTLSGQGGACDTLATYVLEWLPQVSFTDTIYFCPGESVSIHGHVYTQAGVYPDTLPGGPGVCDTLATYVLVPLTPAPSTVKITCPVDIEVTTEPPVAQYNLPTATTDCPCPGLSLQMTEGLPSGSTFPVGVTTVCYLAKDSCGNTASCCFEINVPAEEPCDAATIGCIKYELLSIQKNSAGDKTYRIRVTNTCPNKLMYAAFQLPDGIAALSPANNSIYEAPSGREYSVRNPNYSPFYSIRYKYEGANGLANGESDVFEFTLPAVATVLDIHVIVRVQPKIFYESYLNVTNCPVETVPKPAIEVTPVRKPNLNGLTVFPNPTDGNLFADLSEWKGEQLQLQLFDSRGARVHYMTVTADTAPQEIQLSQNLTGGLYFLEVLRSNGERKAVRLAIQR